LQADHGRGDLSCRCGDRPRSGRQVFEDDRRGDQSSPGGSEQPAQHREDQRQMRNQRSTRRQVAAEMKQQPVDQRQGDHRQQQPRDQCAFDALQPAAGSAHALVPLR
jgi:hypothetical protein